MKPAVPPVTVPNVMEPLLLPQVAGFIVDAIAVGPVGIGAIATVVVPDWQFVVINLDSNV